ncbi:MAG TPA: RNA 2',3'-cyclic phosphodiesterase [Ktedonobacteraceae bacterium]
MTRTFISLEMNEHLQNHLAEVIGQVAQALPRLNWVNPVGIHLTLAFLGELDAVSLEQAMQAAAAAAQQVKPFSYHLTRIGIFGSPHQPHVVWMGIEEKSASLVRLHSVLKQELEQRGFATESRPFSPHLTLAYVKNPLSPEELERLQNILMEKRFISSNEYPVQHVNVMKSELLRSGAEYTCLQAYPLA